MADAAAQLVVAATEGRRDRAEALLAEHPQLAEDPWVALVLGREWDGDPNTAGGPRGWSPLHYATHSVFSDRALVRELLERGADPNAYYANDHGPMSALYGAAGVLGDPELTQLLLDFGADPNGEPHFGDALYHAAGQDDPACLRVLLDGGARVPGSGALGLALDEERPEHVRLLIDAGADLTESAFLVHAVRRGRSAQLITALIDAGAPLDRRGGEWSTPPEQHRTAYSNAVLRNREDLVALLAERGADTTTQPGDADVAAIARGEQPAGSLPAELDPDQQEVVILAALRGELERVVAQLGPGFYGHVGGGPPGTLLHHASWVGDAAIVTRLLELGADPVASSGAEFDTPLAWAVLASAYGGPARDRVGVVEALVAAGAPIEERFADVAAGDVAGWLAARG